MPSRAARALPHVLLAGVLATMLFGFREWAYVTTYRLTPDTRLEDDGASATTRFDLEGDHVVPKLVTHDGHVQLRAAVGRDSSIRAFVEPDTGATYVLTLRQNGADRVLASGAAAGALVLALETGNGIIDVSSTGRVTWSDLRLQRGFEFGRIAGALCALGLGLALCARAGWLSRRGGVVWARVGALLASTAIAGFVAEAGLRAIGPRVSSGIRDARHDLGEVTADPRWEDSPELGHRLRPNVRAVNEWRDGDIVRMGFVPAGVETRRTHRYPFATDAEGFRNARVRDPIDVAALGDSFTDAQTLSVEAAWPSRLETATGWTVQNYGTAGFGPQQERRVLESYALRHRPALVVLAFFAGNDIYEAEALDRAGHIDGAVKPAPKLGWPIKNIVARADTWFVVNALQAAAAGVRQRAALEAVQAFSPPIDPPTEPQFRRGMFSMPVNGRTVRFALMPPYLNTLNFSDADLAARRGWRVTTETLRRMRDATREAGATFVLLFLPSKSQVTLPLLQRAFSRDRLTDALEFYLHDLGGRPDIDRLSTNRLALNRLMQQFCLDERIPFIDATATLQRRLEAGEEVFFPDDSHLSAVGEALIADALLEFLNHEHLGPNPTVLTGQAR